MTAGIPGNVEHSNVVAERAAIEIGVDGDLSDLAAPSASANVIGCAEHLQ